MRALLFLVISEFCLRSTEARATDGTRGGGAFDCRCGGDGNMRRNGTNEDEHDCQAICNMNRAEEIGCLQKINCKGGSDRRFCKDDFNGKLHNVGEVWSRNCTRFSCEENSVVSRKNVACPQVCLVGNNDANKCCPVCKLKLTCSPKELLLEIPMPLLRGADPTLLSLTDSNCRAIVNATHAVLKTGLSSCGTRLSRPHRKFRYSNLVQKNYLLTQSRMIVRPLVRFSCMFSNVLSSFHDQTRVPSFIVSVASLQKNSKITMHYTNEGGEALLGKKKMKFAKGTPIFVAIYGHNINRRTHFLAVESCVLMAKKLPTRRHLFYQGCPVDSTLKIKQKASNVLWFSFKAIRLQSDFLSFMDLQCQAAVCSRQANADICNRKC
eukprot:gene10965-12127_t